MKSSNESPGFVVVESWAVETFRRTGGFVLKIRSQIKLCFPVAAIALIASMSLLAYPATAAVDEFESELRRIDHALATNPNHVLAHALDTCANRRQFAAQLYYSGQVARAMRSLKYCTRILKITGQAPKPKVDRAALLARAELRRRNEASRELEKALELTPDLEHGLEIYRGCAACHTQEGWGLTSGVVPQLAGQHRAVIIKQLADIRSGNRANQLMVPYSSADAIGGAQSVADVAGYIDTLEISVENGKGEGNDLELGAKLYAQNCATCHGALGEGDDKKFRPRIQSQHFEYLLTQFRQIRDGTRKNADPEMVKQIQGFEERETLAVLDFVSRLAPPEEYRAPAGWRNPDFE